MRGLVISCVLLLSFLHHSMAHALPKCEFLGVESAAQPRQQSYATEIMPLMFSWAVDNGIRFAFNPDRWKCGYSHFTRNFWLHDEFGNKLVLNLDSSVMAFRPFGAYKDVACYYVQGQVLVWSQGNCF